MSKQQDEDEILAIANDYTVGDMGDALYEYFENHAPGDDWVELAAEGTRIASMMATEVEEYSNIDYLLHAVAAEAYNRGVRNAADYLGVPSECLRRSVAEMLDGDRAPLSGVVIPSVEYDHDTPDQIARLAEEDAARRQQLVTPSRP